MRKLLASAGAALSAALLLVAPALADPGAPAVGVQLSSLGYGLVLEEPVNRFVSVRLQNGVFSTSQSGTVNGFQYNGQLHYDNVAALLDLHPLGGRFRVSAGLVAGNNYLDGTGQRANGTYTLNGQTYQASLVGSVSASVKTSSLAPYLGVGSGGGARRGLSFSYDVGVVFWSPSAMLSYSNPAAAQIPGFTQNLLAAQAQLARGVGVLRTYPVVDVQLTLRP
ncbi:MAG: hypothetical protein ABR975_15745 [Vulcanimicrobiaceae bacterium]|jgi:hypothetical protein